MKKFLSAILITLTLLASSAALAAEGGEFRIAVIDTGISTAAVDAACVAPGFNYIRAGDDTEDKVGHGTAISAIIVGSAPARVTGICPTATLVPLVIASQDEDGKTVQGDTAMTAQAIYDAVDIYGCRIINISAGAAVDSYTLRGAVSYAARKGVLIVSCAGNNQKTNPGAVYYPGGYDSVLCVGAATEDGAIATFSQQNDTVDVLARGTGLRLASVKGTAIRGYGTSYAAAIVTGAAANIWSRCPDLTAEEVRAAVLDCTREVNGWQVLDLDAAMAWTPYGDLPQFTDVTAEMYYYQPVQWAVAQGITVGTTETTFAPLQTCTQAQILTFLWRAAGMPQHRGEDPYSHAAVEQEQYFYDALLWAWQQGIVTDPALDPGAPCSRSDVVLYLWRRTGSPAAEGTAFTDVSADAPYAQAVQWAVQDGITKGATDTTFDPTGTCTRGQIVTFLYRCFAA